MHTLIVGAVGSGKSVLAQKVINDLLERDPNGRALPHERIWSNVETSGHDVPSVLLNRDNLYSAHCGVLFIDELQNFLGARDWDKLSDVAKDFWTRHRHYDTHIVSTTQHPSFIDKMCRILTDEVMLCNRLSVPFLGWLFPRSVRPPDWCRCPHCQEAKHPRRDAHGDRAAWWQKLFGFGTILAWTTWPPSVLTDTESLDASDLQLLGKVPKGGGFILFDMKWARRASGTVAARRVGSIAPAAPSGRPDAIDAADARPSADTRQARIL